MRAQIRVEEIHGLYSASCLTYSIACGTSQTVPRVNTTARRTMLKQTLVCVDHQHRTLRSCVLALQGLRLPAQVRDLDPLVFVFLRIVDDRPNQREPLSVLLEVRADLDFEVVESLS